MHDDLNTLLRQAAGVDDPGIPPALAKRLDDIADPPPPERTPLDEIREHIEARKPRNI